MTPATRVNALKRHIRTSVANAKQYSDITPPILTQDDDKLLYHTAYLAASVPMSELEGVEVPQLRQVSDALKQKLRAHLDRILQDGSPVEIASVAELRHMRSAVKDDVGGMVFELNGRRYPLVDLIYACRVLGADGETEHWTLRPDGILVLSKYGSKAAVTPLKA